MIKSGQASPDSNLVPLLHHVQVPVDQDGCCRLGYAYFTQLMSRQRMLSNSYDASEWCTSVLETGDQRLQWEPNPLGPGALQTKRWVNKPSHEFRQLKTSVQFLTVPVGETCILCHSLRPSV